MSSGKLFATMLLHIPYSEKLVHPKGRTQAYKLKIPGSAVRHNRLKIISVSNGEVEVEIFLSDSHTVATKLHFGIEKSSINCSFLCLNSKHCAL